MDIDLLSKMVKELILDNDRVALPGLGSFVAEIVPSTFSDKGYTINPPYRRLSFRSKPDDGDMLVRFYATSNGVGMDVARRIIEDFVHELKSVLHSRKVVVFPGLGRLRATKENNVFFIADENLDIYPSGFGLKSVSLKNHQETKEEVTAVVEGLASILVEKQPVSEFNSVSDNDLTTESEDTVCEPKVEPKVEPEIEPKVEPEIEPKVDSEIEPKVEPEIEPKVEPKIEPKVEPEVEPKIELEVELRNESEPKSEDEPIIEAENSQTSSPGPEIVADICVEPHDIVVEEQAAQQMETKVQTGAMKKALFIVLVVLGSLLGLLLLFMLLGRLAPELIDKLLYSAEDLEILYYQFK